MKESERIARLERITGTGLGSLLNMNPWKSAIDYIRDKCLENMGLETSTTSYYGKLAMQWGIEHEKEALRELGQISHLDILPGKFTVHPEYDFLGASPDGLVGDDTVVEIKCPYTRIMLDDLSPGHHYWAQVQMQMFCTGRTRCLFFQWTPEGHHLIDVPVDPDFIPPLVEWLQGIHYHIMKIVRHLEEDEENRDVLVRLDQHLEKLSIDAPGTTVYSEKWRSFADEYVSLRRQYEILADQMKIIRSHMIEHAMENNRDQVHGNGVLLQKREGSRKIDVNSILEDYPAIDSAEYTTFTKPSWNIRLEKNIRDSEKPRYG